MDNLRRFFLTASIIIFASLFIGGFILAVNYDPKEVQTEPGNPTPLNAVGDVYNPEKYELEDYYNENVLFILTSGEKAYGVNFVISKYDPVTQDLSFLIIPDDLKVVNHQNKNSICTLGEYFRLYEGKAVVGYLTSLLEIDIDGFCAITYKDFTEFTKTYGALDCNIPYNIKFISTGASDVNYSTGFSYSKGNISLNGDSIINLIKFIEDDYAALDSNIVEYYDNYYPETFAKEMHSAMSDDFTYYVLKGIVNKFSPENQATIENTFKLFTKTYSNNISQDDLKGMVYKIGETDKSKVNYFRIAGTPEYNKEFYVVYDKNIYSYNSGEKIAANEVLLEYFS